MPDSKITDKTYQLIPSSGSEEFSPHSMSLVPALPVRLGQIGGPTRYGVVNPGAQISMMAWSIASSMDVPMEAPHLRIRTESGLARATVIRADLAICDEQFQDWIQIPEVPFLVLSESSDLPRGQLILGFDHCLSHLKLTIDYPRGILRVTAPLALRAKNKHPRFSEAWLGEARKLYELGSYQEAVAFAALAFEEASRVGEAGEVSFGLRERVLMANRAAHVSPDVADRFVSLRNMAVHGSRAGISKEEALEAIRIANRLIKAVVNPTLPIT
jgi:hypothetical protein